MTEDAAAMVARLVAAAAAAAELDGSRAAAADLATGGGLVTALPLLTGTTALEGRFAADAIGAAADATVVAGVVLGGSIDCLFLLAA